MTGNMAAGGYPLPNKTSLGIFRILFVLIFLGLGSGRDFGNGLSIFQIDDFGGALFSQFQMVSQDVRINNELVSGQDFKYFELGLNLNSRGSIYHPNLVTFNVDLNLIGFSQKDKNILFTDPQINDSLNNTHSIDLRFFRRKKISFSLYSHKQYSSYQRLLEERNFTYSLDNGLTLTAALKIFPFTLSINRLRNRFESLTAVRREEKIDNIKLHLNLIPSNRIRSYLKFISKEYTETVRDASYVTRRLSFDFFLPYGTENRNKLNFLGAFNQMSGDYENRTINFHGQNQYYFTPRFSMKNYVNFSRNWRNDDRIDSLIVSTDVEHRLFESLISVALSEYEQVRSEEQKYDIASYGGRLSYSKKFKYGLFSLLYEKKLRQGDFVSNGDLAERIEYGDFSHSDIFVLKISGVLPGTIEITNLDLTAVYLEGIDYTVDIAEDQVYISRIPGGEISSEDKLRITFQFLAFPDFRMKNDPESFYATLNMFKFFSVFYKKSVSEYSISSDFLITPFNDTRVEAYGLRLDSRLLYSELSREIHQTDGSTYYYTNYRFSSKITPVKNLNINLHYGGNKIEHTTPGIFNEFRSFVGEVDFSPIRNFNIRGFFRKLKYRNNEYEWLRDSLIFKLRWLVRSIVLEAYYEHLLFGSGFSDRYNDYFYIKVRREF